MKLLFVILAHDRPEEAAELAAALTEGATDARAIIHFDARADAALYDRLQAATAGFERVELVEDRVATPWGEWGLVQAPLNAMAQVRASGWAPDRALLLSGACLPCRPVKALERFFVENPEREFIEVAPPTWIQGGLREERYEHWFPFNKQTQHTIHHNFNKLQRIFGIKRKVPEGLIPRFGSQWWALTWATCEALLDHAEAHPDHMRWFRWCWIPDEMAIQTLVGHHVPRRNIAGSNLTHFRFTDHGKPVVYHDDHADYVRGLDAFLFRKAHPEAQGLRAACLALARAPDDGAPVGRDDRAELDYRVRARALSAYPVPGQPFHEGQAAPSIDRVLARGDRRYLVAVGAPAEASALLAALPEGAAPLGHVFAPGRVDFGDGRETFHGLASADVAIRDAHPALYLMRALARAQGLPALAWSPFHEPLLLAGVLGDPNAIVVDLLPRTGDADGDLAALVAACAAPGPFAHGERALNAPLGARRDVLRAYADETGAREVLRRLLPYPMQGEPLPRDAAVTDPAYRARRQTAMDLDRDAVYPRVPPAAPLAAVLRPAAGRDALRAALAASGLPLADALAEALAAHAENAPA